MYGFAALRETQGEARSIAIPDGLCIFGLFFDTFQMNLLVTLKYYSTCFVCVRVGLTKI